MIALLDLGQRRLTTEEITRAADSLAGTRALHPADDSRTPTAFEQLAAQAAADSERLLTPSGE